MNTPLLSAPYLREQRQFPNDNVDTLARQIDHAYIDIASKVNLRVIGVFANTFYVINGERWYLTGSSTSQQALRQVFLFNAAGAINHNITAASLSKISPRSYGSYTDGTNWYGVIYASTIPILGQVTFYVTPTQIVIVSAATAPAITSGIIVLEYISNF